MKDNQGRAYLTVAEAFVGQIVEVDDGTYYVGIYPVGE